MKKRENYNEELSENMTEKQIPKVGVGILITKNNRVLMGLRKGSHGEGTWSPSGGHLEFGESIEECARREVKEETNLEIDEVRIIGFTNDVFESEGKHYITIFTTAHTIGDPELMEPNKCEKWEWFDWDNLPENIFLPVQHAKEQGLDPRK